MFIYVLTFLFWLCVIFFMGSVVLGFLGAASEALENYLAPRREVRAVRRRFQAEDARLIAAQKQYRRWYPNGG